MRVDVVGGGIAGLTTGYLLARDGAEVTVYEREAEFGGLASAFDYGDAKVERYYHFICRPDAPYLRLIDELGLTPKLEWRPTKMGYFHHGSYFPFGTPLSLLGFSPLSLASRARFGMAALRSRGMTDWHALDDVTAKEWLVQTQGQQAFDVVWRPLLTFKFGDRADSVSAAWMWARINRVANSREGLAMREYLGYLEGGTETLIDALVAEIEQRGGSVLAGTTVEEVVTENGVACGVRTNGELHDSDVVVTTVAPRILLDIAQELPEQYAAHLAEIGYYGVACWVLIAKEALSEDFWLNIDDERISFSGVITYTNLNPIRELRGRHVLYIPMYMSTSDTRYGAPPDDSLPPLLAALDRIKPGFSKAVEASFLFRDEYAQPLFDAGFERRFGNLRQTRTPIRGLYRTDMSQIYPDDRSLVNAIAKAYELAEVVSTDR